MQKMTSHDIHVRISSGSIITTLLFVLLAALLWFLRDLVLTLLSAVVIASAMEPAVRYFSKKGISRIISVIFIYLVLAVALLSILFFFAPPLLNDTATLLRELPQTFGSFNVADITHGLLPLQSASTALSSADFLSSISQSIAQSTGGAFTTLSVFFGGLTSFALIILFSFYFSVQETGVDDFLRIVTPIKEQAYVLHLWKRSQDKIGRWMQGQLVLATLVGVLLYLGLLILNVNYALLLAVVAGIFELLPIFGQFLAAIPAIIVGFATGGVTTGLLVTGLYLIVQQFEANLIYPVVVKKVVGVPPLLVILAMLVGFKLFGFLGALLAVPIAAAIQEFVSDIDREKKLALARAGLASDGEAK